MSRRVTSTIVFVMFPALLLGSCRGGGPQASPSHQPDEATIRRIPQGEIVGYVSHLDDATGHAWLGVPFARPPVGDLRWRAPRAPEPWQGRREALAFSDWCVQYTTSLDEGYGYTAGELHGSEDCLYLNVYAPAFAPREVPSGDAALPVMVWIHGGGNVWGRSSQFDGTALAAKEDVVVVTIQYRLGPLGWLAHPALRATADEPLDRTANFATLDMLAALAWVRESIAAFGGDPTRVTIFGESAGGRDVASLLVTPQAAGMFERAIIQSGNVDTVPLDVAEGSAPDPFDRKMPGAIGVIDSLLGSAAPSTPTETAAAMRRIDVAALYAAYYDPEGAGDLAINPPRVIADGVVLPEEGILDALTRPKSSDSVPVMAGTNRDETKLFNALNSRLTNRYLGVIILPKDQRMYDLIAEYQSQAWQARAVDAVADALGRSGNDDVFAYRFDWDEEGSFLWTNFATLFGASHSWEIPFLFDNWNYAGRLDRVLWTEENAEARLALSRAMMGYWAEFAHTGDPGAGGGPAWEPWDGGRRIVFDTAAGGGIRMEPGTLTMGEIFDRLETDHRLRSDEERCTVYRAVVAWSPATAEPSFLGGACGS